MLRQSNARPVHSTSDIVLWDYPKSSASYRVRIALNLAGLNYQIETIDLLGNAQRSAAHIARNPQGLVPVLDIDGHRMTQSLAMIEYLDERHALGLLPSDPIQRARVRALAYALAIDVHPVCNLSVATFATGGLEPARTSWMQHFIKPGLVAFEALLGDFDSGPYCASDTPSLADICLIPQLYNARRWGVTFDDCPNILAAEQACSQLDSFSRAAPI